ncbi:MAG: hypothetical protein ACK5HY_06425, partial [Parahaliea sp.]
HLEQTVPRILLLLAIAAAIYVLYLQARSQPPHKRRAAYTRMGVIVAVAVVILLTLTGHMHWVGAALTGLLVMARQLLPTLVRLFPALAHLRARNAQAGPQQSTVETAILRMHLDHSNGNLSGEVLKGPFREWYLDEMDRPQLDQLLHYCRREDADSAQLLQGYLEQRFPGGTGDTTAGTGGDQAGDTGQGGAMNRKEALAILGLADSATEEEIVAAHRSLIQKLHPDRGGSDYLAARINEAKDFLLG